MPATSPEDAETVFIVRAMLAGAGVGVLACLLIAAAAKLFDPSYDAGRLAFDIGWPLGFVGALVVAQRRHRPPTGGD